MTRTRCLFVLPSLRGGGAERVMTTLLQHLDVTKFDLHLAVIQNSGPNTAQIPQHVTVHDLHASRVARSLVPLVRTIRRLGPDVVFSTMFHMNMATALTRPAWPRGVRCVLRETNLTDHASHSTWFPRLRRAIYRQMYRQADTVVCQTPYMRADLQRAFRLPSSQLVVIPNPVDFSAIESAIDQQHCPLETAGPNIVALGRLRPVKGTERLLQAFPRLLKRHPAARLWLLGDGPCEAELRRQASSLGIERHVHFAGYQQNPYAWLSAADLMAVSSHVESSSNAILEAVACGCPTVALQHPGGTHDMLAGLGLSDRFVPHLDTWDDEWFQQLPATSLERAQAEYNVQTVVAQYENVLL